MIDGITLIKPGIIQLGETKAKADKSISTGTVIEGGKPKVTEVGNNIILKPGVVFGVQFQVEGKPKHLRVPLRIVWRYPQPGLKSPDSATPKLVDDYVDKTPAIGETFTIYWKTGADAKDEWQLVPGIWTAQVWRGERKLLTQDFVLTKP